MASILLGSQSPRRRQLLTLLNTPFKIMAADADEDSVTVADPAQNVLATAELKIDVLLANERVTAEPAILLTADTNVAIDNQILGKPRDADEARATLQLLRGRQHRVHTGMVLHDMATGTRVKRVHSAEISFRPYSDAEIERYIATGDPFDKAGSYAIQHPEFSPMAQLDGCYLGVMGLSVCQLLPLLSEIPVSAEPDLTAIYDAHRGCPCPILHSEA